MGLEEALLSGQTAAESPATLLPPLAAEPLSLRLGGEDVHLVLHAVLGLKSELVGRGSEAKFLGIKSERSGLSLVMFVSCDEASRGCGGQLH